MNFLTKLVALKPGRAVQEMIKNVMQGKDEGAENSVGDEEHTTGQRASKGIAGRVSFVLYFVCCKRPNYSLRS